MRVMTRLQSTRLALAALWHTINWPQTWLGWVVISYMVFYFAFFWQGKNMLEGVVLGIWIVILIGAGKAWIVRASRWVIDHAWYQINLKVVSERGEKRFVLTVPPNFPKDDETRNRIFRGIH